MKYVKNEKGLVILIVLTAVAILSIIMTEFIFSSHVNLNLAKNNAKRLQAYYLAKSGVKFALLELKIHQTLQKHPLVKQFLGDNPAHLDVLWKYGFVYPPPLEKSSSLEGIINAMIKDEGAKININGLGEKSKMEGIKNQIISLISAKLTQDEGFRKRHEGLVPERIANNITDWIDSNQERIEGGWEASFYEKQTPPYEVKNSPLDSLSELSLIEDIDDELVNFLTPYLTTIDSPGINVNNAPAEILSSLSPDFTKEDVDEIIKKREEAPFKSPQEFEQYVRETLLKTEFNKSTKIPLTTSSDIFSIESTANLGETTLALKALVNRTLPSPEGAPVILYWGMD